MVSYAMGIAFNVTFSGRISETHQSLPDVVETMRLVLFPCQCYTAVVTWQFFFGNSCSEKTKVLKYRCLSTEVRNLN
jgi:hypothetical protein